MSDAASQAASSAASLQAFLTALRGTHRFLTLAFNDPVLPSAEPSGDRRGAPQSSSGAEQSAILSSILAVEAFAAVDGLHEIGARDVLLLCADPHLPLKQLVSRRATLRIDGGGDRGAAECVFSGLVSEAERLGSEAGLARYRVRLVPWVWLLSQSSGCRVWQDAGVTDIVDDILRQYQPHAAWRWTAEATAFLQEARTRPITVQYRETDLAFVSRLLAEEGLTWRIEERGSRRNEKRELPAPCGHVLVLLADTTHAGSMPDDATSARDAETAPGSQAGGLPRDTCHDAARLDCIQGITPTSTLRSVTTTVLAPGPLGARSIAAWTEAAPGCRSRHAPPVERYDPSGAPAWQDISQAERQAKLLQQAVDARTRRITGRSTVRSLRSGTRIAVAADQTRYNPGQAPTFFGPDIFPGGALSVLRVVSVGINNLPKPAQEAADRLLGSLPALLASRLAELLRHNAALSGTAQLERLTELPELIERARAAGYANAFEALPAALPWRPVLADGTGERWRPRSTAPGSQTAIVVDESGHTVATGASEVCCDQMGRVRIRFLWQDALAGSGGEGTGMQSAGQRHAACWVRVAQRAAGSGMGLHFLPRIGQEVLVQFIDGDIEQPVVVGAVYNGCGEGGVPPTPGGLSPSQGSGTDDPYASASDHQPSAQTNLTGGHSPVWHGASPGINAHRNAAAQWGIRSKEHGGYGYNQLLFDDSQQQGRLQLRTTHAGTELSMGHLIHAADNYRGSFRGTGIELRTDAYGAVRAGAGLLLSTYPRQYNMRRRDPAGDNAPGVALLRQAHDVLQACSRAAAGHETVALAGVESTPAPARAAEASNAASPVAALLQAAGGMVSRAGCEKALADLSQGNPTPSNGAIPHVAAPIIALSAKAGWTMTADGAIGIHAGTVAAAAAGKDWQSTTGERLRVHAGQAIGILAGAMDGSRRKSGKDAGRGSSPMVTGEAAVQEEVRTGPHDRLDTDAAAGAGSDAGAEGLSLIAARGPSVIEAHQGEAKLRARELVNIQSAHGPIDWTAAKKITLATEGGARITIENGNITIACPGKLTVHASRKQFDGPVRVDHPLPQLPKGICVECLQSARLAGSPFALR